MDLSLTRYGRPAASVFDLLGRSEVDLTAAVGWTLSAAPALMTALLELLDLDGPASAVEVALEVADDQGRTDIELTGSTWKVVIEAKQGWIVPEDIQLAKYAGRLEGFDGQLVTMSDSSKAWAATALGTDVAGIPVRHEPWDTVRRLIGEARQTARARERIWLDELETYMGTATSHRPYEDQWVFCVVVSEAKFGGISFRDYVLDQRRYFHPYGRSSGWPRRPPNFLAFRWGGRVRQVNRVAGAQVVADLRELWPAMTDADADRPHLVYELGPDIPVPPVPTKGTYANARVWCLLDQLLTQPTLKDAGRGSYALKIGSAVT